LRDLRRVFACVAMITAAQAAPLMDVLYNISTDGRILASRRPDCPAFVFGDHRMGHPPKGIPPERYYQWDAVIVAAAKTYGIDPVLLKAILETESGFQWRVVSKAGAQGIGQLMPDTARRLGVKNPFDPNEAIWGSAAHLRQTADRFKTQNMVILASAYNAGDGAVASTLARVAKRERFPDLLRMVPVNAETPGYIQKVLWTWDRIHRGN